MSDLSDAVKAIESLTEAVARAADGIEGLRAIQERDEARRAGRGLFELAAKYTEEEPERTPLRVVR